MRRLAERASTRAGEPSASGGASKTHRATGESNHPAPPRGVRGRARHGRRRLLGGGPAGYGKTIALIDYLQKTSAPHVWYRIDEGDQDIASFFHYMKLSLRGRQAARSLPVFVLEYADQPRAAADVPRSRTYRSRGAVPDHGLAAGRDRRVPAGRVEDPTSPARQSWTCTFRLLIEEFE